MALSPVKSALGHGLAQSVVDKGNTILNQDPGVKGQVTIFREFRAFAKAENLLQPSRHVHPSEMMVSMYNRTGLMVTGFDVHTKLAAIMRAGVDTPTDAWGFEHCPVAGDPLHDEQVAAMRQCIERSNGLLAPLTGAERVCMIATNHCGQAARATLAGCRTILEELKDVNGCLNIKHMSLGRHSYNKTEAPEVRKSNEPPYVWRGTPHA